MQVGDKADTFDVNTLPARTALNSENSQKLVPRSLMSEEEEAEVSDNLSDALGPRAKRTAAPAARRHSNNKMPQIVLDQPRGQLAVNLVEARHLTLKNPRSARLYCIVEFEKNEFLTSDASLETPPKITSSASFQSLAEAGSGAATPKGSKGGIFKKIGLIKSISQTSLSALFEGASPKAQRKKLEIENAEKAAHQQFSRELEQALEPVVVWNQEAQFDVARTDGDLIVNMFNRVVDADAEEDEFVGAVRVRPPKIEGKTSDNWYRLLGRQFKDKLNGEIRIQFTYTPAKVKGLAIEDFELLKVLGKGSFGKVVQARKKDSGRIYAIKILNKKDIVARREVEHTIAEKQVLMQIDSPFLVGLKFAFQNPEKLYLVLDFINGGEMFFHLQKVGRFPEDRARFYAAELVLALQHLHESNIIYRDLKPENILVDANGHIALADFGLCKQGVIENDASTFCGTAEYLAPEILAGRRYGRAVDWWSLGILLFEMMAGIPPFYSKNTNQMYQNILYSPLNFPPYFTAKSKLLIAQLLERDPRRRLGCGATGADEIKDHAFFQPINWDKLMLKQVKPPFKPKVTTELDVSNFDPQFTDEKPTDSPQKNTSHLEALSPSTQLEFSGFTFHGRESIIGVTAVQEGIQELDIEKKVEDIPKINTAVLKTSVVRTSN